MKEKEKLESIAASLLKRFPGSTLELVDEIFDTGNRFLRFREKGRGLRVEITRIALEDLPADAIVSRLAKWHPSHGDAAVRVYSDRIEEVPWDAWD